MQQYFQPLSSIATIDSLPEPLSFVNDGIELLLSGIYYRDLQYVPNATGDGGFYSMMLIVYKEISLEVPGTGFVILLNPPEPGQSGYSQIPISVNYQWKILRYIKEFDLKRFSGDSASYMRILNSLVRATGVDVVIEAVKGFVSGDMTAGAIQTLVGEINTAYQTEQGYVQIVLDSTDPEEMIEELVAAIKYGAFFVQHGIDAAEAIRKAYVEQAGNVLEAVDTLYKKWMGASATKIVNDLLVPSIDATLRLGIALDFPRSVLVPLHDNPADPATYLKPIEDESVKARLKFNPGFVSYSNAGGFGYHEDMTADLSLAQIGNTGLRISFSNAKLDLSRTTNLPEADADGRPKDFIGVYVEEATVYLPTWWQDSVSGTTNTAVIKGRKLLIGTGGLSGTIAMEPLPGATTAPLIHTTFGDSGFRVTLDRFSITFHQGKIETFDIHGSITIDDLKTDTGAPLKIGVDIMIHEHGFELTGKLSGGVTIKVGEIFTYTIKTAGIGQNNGVYFLSTSGILNVLATIPGTTTRFLPKPVDIRKLIIWSNGRIDFESGGIVLPEISPLKVGPVELSVSAIHIGTHEQQLGPHRRHYKFFGFDGGVNTGIGGVDARGEGIKFYFTDDDNENEGKLAHSFLRIETIRVDLTIPGNATEETAVLLLKGYVSMKNKEGSGRDSGRSETEYAGGVHFVLPKLKMAGGADLRLIPSIGAFLIDAKLELATPIALGTTGLGIYGFRGTFGNKYVVSKTEAGLTEDASWWEYYRAPQLGINAEKFAQKDGFSIGAGVSIATMADSGTAFSSKLFFMLSMPELFLLEGQASILSKRIGLDTTDDPPFYAVIFISPEEIRTGFGANVKIPDTRPSDPNSGGEILTLDASMEMAFFFGRSSAWYIHLGQDQPEEKRIRGRLLKLFDAYAYFMLSASGIKAGAGVDWKFKQDCGIATVGLGASLEVGGWVNFRPVQIGGFIRLAGYAELKVFGIGFRLDVSATLRAEAPKPFIISGDFSLSLSTPWPLPDVDVHVGLSWHINDEKDKNEIQFVDARKFQTLAAYAAETKHPAKALHMMSQEPFLLNFVNRPYNDPAHDIFNIRHDADANLMRLPKPGEYSDPGALAEGRWVGPFSTFTIPMDCFIDFEFTKGIRPVDTNASIQKLGAITTGFTASENVPPQKVSDFQVTHEYNVENVHVKVWKPTSTTNPEMNGEWVDYDMAAANTPLRNVLAEKYPAMGDGQLQSIIGQHVKYGYWQMTQAGSYSKLRILARTPLDKMVDVKGADADFPETMLLCPEDPLPKTCQNWTAIPSGRVYAANTKIFDRKLSFRIAPSAGAVVPFTNPFGLPNSVVLARGNSIEIFLPQATTSVSMKLSTLAEKVTISYYLGYPYTPKPASAPSASGGAVDTWDAVPASVDEGTAGASLWEKLMAMPGFVRTICTDLDDTEPAAQKILDLLDRFAPVSFYLRQLLELSVPDDEAPLCERLRTILETLIISLTGAEGVPEYLEQSVEHFHDELAGYIAEYRDALGEPDMSSDPGGNVFYEKWMELVVCLGRICDVRSTLPENVERLLVANVDQAVNDLHGLIVDTLAASAGVTLYAPGWVTDPCGRLRTIAEFIALVTLDLPNFDLSIADDLEPYYARLDKGMLTVKRGLRKYGVETGCGGGGGCSTAHNLVSITRRLCIGTPTGDTSAIEALIDGYEAGLGELWGFFGWSTPAAGANLCEKLRRALAPVLVAMSVIEELPFAMRDSVETFHAELISLFGQYQEETDGDPVDLPDPTIDQFCSVWLERLRCLCDLCAKMGAIEANAGLLSQLETALDPEINALFMIANGQMSGNGRPALGDQVATDTCVQLQSILNFFSVLGVRCDQGSIDALTAIENDIDANHVTVMNDALDLFIPALQGAGYTFCDGPILDDGFMMRWIEHFECIKTYCSRKGELPDSLRTEIMARFGDLIFSIHYDIFTPTIEPSFPTALDLLCWRLTNILGFFYDHLLKSTSMALTLQNQIDTYWSDMLDTIMSFHASLLDLGIDVCSVLNGKICDRRKQLVWFYRTLCSADHDQWFFDMQPITDLIQLMHDANQMFIDLTDQLALDPIPSDWTNDGFRETFGAMLGALAIGYSRSGELPLALIMSMNVFADQTQEFVDMFLQYISPVPASGDCVEISDAWLERLSCLCMVCRYGDYLSSTASDAFSQYMAGPIASLYTAVTRQADAVGTQIEPNRRSLDRCRKIRAISNFIAIKSMDYDHVSDELMTPLGDQSAFIAALAAFKTAAQGAGIAICPVKADGPYDPLKKRESKTREDLLYPVEYDDPATPIDRIIIQGISTCPATPPTGWLEGYWSQMEAAAQSALDALDLQYTPIHDEWELQHALDPESPESYDLKKQLDAITANNQRLTDYMEDIPPTPAPSYTPCLTFIHEVCWLPTRAYNYNLSLPPYRTVLEASRSMKISLRDLNQPIWRPNTYYAIQVETVEKITGEQPYRKNYTFGFKTAGPIGHFHQVGNTYRDDYAALKANDREGEYKYANLKHYIDFDRSYPNADGNIINAKPLFYRSPKLLVSYKYDYVHSMYSGWCGYQNNKYVYSTLEIQIKDPARKPTDPPVAVQAAWALDPAPRLSKAQLVFNTMIRNLTHQGKRCVAFDPILQPPAKQTEISLEAADLQPMKMYTAVFNAVFAELDTNPCTGGAVTDPGPDARHEVHKYVFQTSRYQDFPDQIESYKLDTRTGHERNAFYEIHVDLSGGTDRTVAGHIINGTIPTSGVEKGIVEGLIGKFADPYDRLIYGALKLPEMAPAVTTEFTVIRDSGAGDLPVALLIKSPEPFNDPKIPADVMATSLDVPSLGSARRTIFSKDCAKIVVSRDVATIPTGSLGLSFKYLVYSGASYAPSGAPVAVSVPV